MEHILYGILSAFLGIGGFWLVDKVVEYFNNRAIESEQVEIEEIANKSYDEFHYDNNQE